MISGLYAGATNMMGQGEYQAIIARNLANINTVGYKKNVAIFESYVTGADKQEQKQEQEASKGSGSTLGKVATDFSQGVLNYTGNDLDIAVKGDGFFEVQTKNGILYTRKGSFTLSRDRTIVTPEGWALMSYRGAIQIPKNAQSITIKADGVVSVDGKDINKLRVVDFSKPEDFEPVGGSAYKLSKNAQPPGDSTDFEIAHGYLEKSNVNAIDEMVNMIANMRNHQYGYKSTESINESLKKLIGLAS